MKRKVIIDTDTAGDDTTAILMAMHYFDVKGLTIVSGNIDFDQQVENALYTIEVGNSSSYIPVFKGYQNPLMTLPGSKHTTEERIFANDGMGNSNFSFAKQRAEKKHAIDFMIETIHENPNEIEVIGIGPLTNIAMAIKKDPTIVPKIKHLWIMGGVHRGPGNIQAVAEFNFYTDPEAAKIVLHSGMRMTMVPWNVCLADGVMYESALDEISALKTRGAEFFMDVNLHVREFEKMKRNVDGVTCPDSMTVALAANEDLMVESDMYYVDIELGSPMMRGYNLVDVEHDLGQEPNVRVCEKVDTEMFQDALLDVLGSVK